MKFSRVLVVGLFSSIAFPTLACGAFIHESATLGTTGYAWNTCPCTGPFVFTIQFPAARFSVEGTANVTAVGGHIVSHNPGTIFAAILQLSGPDALPTGDPFDAGEVIATSLFTPPTLSADVSVPLVTTLPPGDYALLFGTGLYGATGTARMHSNNPDLPEASYFYYQSGFGWIEGGSSNSRFWVQGNIIPEPDTALLSLPAIFGLYYLSRKYSHLV